MIFSNSVNDSLDRVIRRGWQNAILPPMDYLGPTRKSGAVPHRTWLCQGKIDLHRLLKIRTSCELHASAPETGKKDPAKGPSPWPGI